MAERSPYQLTEQENSRIYKDRIEPILLATAQVSGHERPRLIMLGGQPGSGKTFLLRNPAELELEREGGAISIDADEMRTYHPAAESFKNEDDRTAAMHTHPGRCVGQSGDRHRDSRALPCRPGRNHGLAQIRDATSQAFRR